MMAVPQYYDPTTLFHWLWWRVKCLEATATEFQRLFETVAPRIRSDFMKVRPYGNIGDRKCDGLFWCDGTVFQVYSPDELRQKDTLDKIEEDLSGAVAEWGDQLKRWVFVYNTRTGVGPDVPEMLKEQQRRYPKIEVEPLSSEALWEDIRGLSLQQRVEILGAPPGYEALFLLPGTGPAEIQERIRQGRVMVFQDVLSPINVRDAADALESDLPFGPPYFVRPTFSADDWSVAAEQQATAIKDLVERSRDLVPRFAVFSLAPIPLAIHLGFLFSDRLDLRWFQFDRDRRTWRWSEDSQADADFAVSGLPEEAIDDPVDVIIRVSLSATIAADDTAAVVSGCSCAVDLRVKEPDVTWLQSPDQLEVLSQSFRGVLKDVRHLVPNCRRIHLFYAGPTGGAIAIGQAINPRMTPEVILYEYDRRRNPRYERVLSLG